MELEEKYFMKELSIALKISLNLFKSCCTILSPHIFLSPGKLNRWTAMEVEFSERIKSVFDVCDSDGSGYITVDHLKELARDHFGADNEEVKYNHLASGWWVGVSLVCLQNKI